MLPIVNERGTPGIAGTVLTGRDGARHLLSCHHVLYGNGAGDGGRIWAVSEHRDRRSYDEIGRTCGGELGRITYAGVTTFIDCAVGALRGDASLPGAVRRALHACASIPAPSGPAVGQRVHKHGWVTGHTWGVIADTRHYERPWLDGQVHEAPGQLLIRPEDRDHCFSAPGESGAAVLDDEDRIVGLLWGANANGDGIAFPIAAAFQHLGLTPAMDGGSRR
jgi:hypothetical protein